MADGEVYRYAPAATPVRDRSVETVIQVPATNPSPGESSSSGPASAPPPAPTPVAKPPDAAVLVSPAPGTAPDRPGEPVIRVLEIPFEKAWAVAQMA